MKRPTLVLFGRREIRAGTVEVRRNPAHRDARRPAFPHRSFAALIAIAILGLLAVSFGSVVLDSYQLNQEAERLRADIARLQAENQRLQEEVAELQTDAAIERLAREKLGWTRADETGIVIVPTDPDARVPEEVGPTQSEPPPNWERWRQLFFGP